MKPSQTVINYIKKEPRFRKRANKNRGLANLLLKMHPVIQSVDPKIFSHIIGEVLTMDRVWRKFMADNPDFRGSDYDEKGRLEQVAMAELGYEVGFKDDMDKLSTLN